MARGSVAIVLFASRRVVTEWLIVLFTANLFALWPTQFLRLKFYRNN